LKEKFYRTSVVSTMLYSMKCSTVKNQNENQVSVTDIVLDEW